MWRAMTTTGSIIPTNEPGSSAEVIGITLEDP